MSRRVLIYFIVLLGGCGENDNNEFLPSGDADPTYGPCEERASSGSVTSVDLRIESPLPGSFTTGCARGVVTDLEAYILVDVLSPCFVDVAAAGVSGCCPNIPAGKNYSIVMVYRDGPSRKNLAEQIDSFVELPTASAPVMSLSFAGAVDESQYDADHDGTGNLTEWCNGTL